MPVSPIGARATVVGGGLMGCGIAHVLAAGGITVSVYEPSSVARATVLERIGASLDAVGAARDPLDAITVTEDLEQAVADADWVFEAAPERLELKRELFARIDGAAPANAILATNTSVISVGEIAADTRSPERVVGAHWWNPAYLVPLVEVVQAERTSPKTVAATIELLQQLGKTPVHVRRDVPGFVGNRLQHALWREAFSLIDDGVCDATTVDTVVKSGFGLRLPVLGPIENADLVGLGLTLDIHEYILPRLDPPSAPSPGLRARVERGDLGVGTGHGFRDWAEGEADALRARLTDHLLRTASTATATQEETA